MKVIYKLTIILISFLISASCADEKMINPDPDFILSFQRDGQSEALAGTQFYVIPNGSGEFLTLYDGNLGHVWGDENAKGTDFNGSDSLGITYKTSGTYKITLVASSSGDFGNDFSREVKTVAVSVIDQRNSFKSFAINDMDGAFTPNNEILFSVPDVVSDFKFVAEYKLDSDESTVFVNGIKQVSGETVNDFTNPVKYTIKSAEGTEKVYTVKFSTFASSDANEVTKFVLGKGGNNEAGEVDQTTKTIHVTANYSSDLEAVRLVLESSYGSEIYLNDELYSNKVSYDLTTIKTLKVVAQDGSEANYSIDVVTESPVSSFTFAGLVPEPVGEIDEGSKTITVNVLKETDVTQLIALWTGTLGKVTVGGVDQVNGTTVNDFSGSVVYTFYKGNKEGDSYTVIVNQQ